MQHARDELLAGARLAGEEHGAVAPRDALHEREHRAQRRVVGDDVVGRVEARQARVHHRMLAREPPLLPRAAHEHVDLRHPVRLGEVVVGAELHRADRAVDRRVPRDDDDLGGRRILPHRAQHLEAVHRGHQDVEERDVEALRAQRVERRAAIRALRHVAAALDEELREHGAQMRLVLRHEHFDPRGLVHAAPGANGSRTRKVLPRPTALSTSMRPP